MEKVFNKIGNNKRVTLQYVNKKNYNQEYTKKVAL